jgi:hypothetical protein
MFLLHSYQFITNKDVYISKNQKQLIDNKGSVVIGLANIPSNKNYYTVHVTQDITTDYNIKIMVDLDYSKLYGMIKNNKPIPNKTELISLIQRNSHKLGLLDIPETDNLYSHPHSQPHSLALYEHNIVVINNIYVNLDTKQFYLSQPKQHTFNVNGLIIIGSYDYTKCYGKRILIIHDNKNAIHHYSNKSHGNIRKYTVVDKMTFLKNPEVLLESKWDKVILDRITDPVFIPYTCQFKTPKILFIHPTLMTETTLHKIIYIALGTTKMNINFNFNNSHNIETLKNIIFKLKPKVNKNINKKSMKLSYNEKRYSKYLDTDTYRSYLSFPNNYSHNKYITPLDFKKKNTVEQICSICLDTILISNMAITECQHYFCKKCIHFNLKLSNSCPNCRKKIKQSSVYLIGKHEHKNSKLLYILEKIKQKKTIVVLSEYAMTVATINNIIKSEYVICSRINAIETPAFNKLYSNKKINEIIFMDSDNINFTHYVNLLGRLLDCDTYKLLEYKDQIINTNVK